MTTSSTPPTAAEVSPEQASGSFAWYHTLGEKGKKAFKGAFMGYALDSYDFYTLPLGLAAIIATFGLTKGEAGLLATATLVASAFGGIVAGVLVDKIGRSKTLMVTVVTYAVFTALCGIAPNYETLLVFRALQGIGFGGEWAAGAILIAEYAKAEHRGRAVAMIQSSWAVGWGLANIVSLFVLTAFDSNMAWRILFFTGAAPALLVIYVRRSVHDAPSVEGKREKAQKGSLAAIFQGGLARRSLFAILLATGVQGGYYTLATWVPTYLKTPVAEGGRGLTTIGTGWYLFFLIFGAFCGYLTGGWLTDRIGRKNTFALFAVLSGVLILGYTQLPASAAGYIMYLGFPLGFTSSAIFSGFGAFLSELYPSHLRGTGQGTTYNTGRAFGAFFPTIIGFLSTSIGIGGAMGFGAAAYGIALVALLGLPETRNTELA
jgi:MFS family permease